MIVFDQLGKNDRQLRLLAQIVFGGVLVLLAGLWWVQIVSYRNYQAHQETQSFRTIRIPAMRGKILDRNGVVLADSRPSYNVSLYLEELRKDFDAAYTGAVAQVRGALNARVSAEEKRLGRKLTLQERKKFPLGAQEKKLIRERARIDTASRMVAEISGRLAQPLTLDEKTFTNHYNKRLALPYPILPNLTSNQLARFEEQPIKPMGVDLDVQATRFYPYQTTAAHLLGQLKHDDVADSSKEGEESSFSYRLPDYRGLVGIEYGFDAALHGRAGSKSVLVNNLGYRQTENILSPVEPGSNVVLTIDLKIQQAAETALQHGPSGANTRGAVVVMDVNTGDILALASSPTFNPNGYVQGYPPDEYKKMQESGAEHNRATGENYAPGSIFKPITGLACLENGLNPKATIYNPPNPADPAHGHIKVGTRTIHDTAPPGDYNFRRAIVRSCNTYFITNGMKTGIERIVRLGQKFHLGENVKLQTRQDAAGKFPSLERVESKNWRDGDTANICFGQGEVAVTPIQIAVVYSAIANGGKILWPQLVDHIEPQDVLSGGEPILFEKSRVRDNLGVSERSMKILHEAMLGETEDAEGTGKVAIVPGLHICGKTGTAQVSDSENRHTGWNYWFASFAPYENPRYAVVVLVESQNTGSGGTTCAPIAHEVYMAIQKMENAHQSKTLALAQ
jgi:penicillin-binding protein 2